MSIDLESRWKRIKARVEARGLEVSSKFDSIWLPRVAEFGTWCYEHPRATAGIMIGCAAAGGLIGFAIGALR